MQDPNRQTSGRILDIHLRRRLDAIVVDRQPERRRHRLTERGRRGGRTQQAHLRLGQRANRIEQ